MQNNVYINKIIKFGNNATDLLYIFRKGLRNALMIKKCQKIKGLKKTWLS